MMVKLIPLQGQLLDRQSSNSKAELEIRQRRFVIGSASDCTMYCRSDRISPHHCQLRIESEKVVLEDLASETGTFVNDRRIRHACVLHDGDRLRIGRLEFAVLIEDPRPVWEVGPRTDSDTLHDAMANTVCDLLTAADERDRARRRQHPELRQFSLPATGTATGTPEKGTSISDGDGGSGRSSTEEKRGSLPATTRPQQDSSVAAAEALDNYFTTRKVYVPWRRSTLRCAAVRESSP